MTPTLVLNDHHLGVERTGGTTLASAADLREYALQQHRRLLRLAPENGAQRIIFNGDLADTYSIALSQALAIYSITDEFMTEFPHIDVVWALGNHDLSKDSTKLGTVAFIGALLEMKHARFRLVSKPTALDGGVYVIPHMPNQEIFEHELGRVPDGTKYLLLHCNFSNPFAGQQDHSLELTREVAKGFRDRDITMVLGHEHQGRRALGGRVLIVGNQFPTSVSDCLAHGDGQADGKKYALLLSDEEPSLIPTWTPDDEGDGWFAEVDWRELDDVTEDGRGFIRVIGDAGLSESANVVKAISKFRQRSRSFVVTNAVKVESAEGMDGLADTVEDIRKVDVIGLLMEFLNPEEQKVIQGLVGEKQ